MICVLLCRRQKKTDQVDLNIFSVSPKVTDTVVLQLSREEKKAVSFFLNEVALKTKVKIEAALFNS